MKTAASALGSGFKSARASCPALVLSRCFRAFWALEIRIGSSSARKVTSSCRASTRKLCTDGTCAGGNLNAVPSQTTKPKEHSGPPEHVPWR